jgi:hypothetical protein
MMATGKIETPYGTVFWCSRPTKRDPIGCDGLYVDRVELKPVSEWPVNVDKRLHAAMVATCNRTVL